MWQIEVNQRLWVGFYQSIQTFGKNRNRSLHYKRTRLQPLKSICQQIRGYFEVKTSDVVKQSLLRNERFIKDQMNNGTGKPITNGSHADVIGNKPIFFVPVEVGCTLSKIIIIKRLIENICKL